MLFGKLSRGGKQRLKNTLMTTGSQGKKWIGKNGLGRVESFHLISLSHQPQPFKNYQTTYRLRPSIGKSPSQFWNRLFKGSSF
jgi:hypothetical protein